MGQYWLDGVVLLAYFAVIMGIGLSQRSKSDSVEGFALGDRQMPWWAVLASILAAEISAATFLGAPGEGYSNRNWTYAQLVIGTILARIIVSYLFIPLYYKHGVVSIYEFLGNRFGPKSRKLASATFLVTRVLAMGTRLYVSALVVVIAVEAMYGNVSSEQKFWLFAGAVILVTVMTSLYTAAGGIRAVIWTDFIQVGVLVASLGFTIPFLLSKIPGGLDTVMQSVQAPVFFDTAPIRTGEGTFEWIKRILGNEYTIYSAFIASTFVTMATHGIDQDTVQRMLTAKNRKQSAFATIASGLVDLPVVCAFVFIGLLLHTFYQANPVEGLPTEDREIFPYFIVHQMSPGLRGLVVAGILATSMGSLSTALNALATSFSQDFLFPWARERKGELTEKTQVRYLRLSTGLFAGFIILVGVVTAYYMAHHPEARIIPLVLGILGFTFGSLLALFLVAFFTKNRGNDFGNILALCAGVVAVLLASGTHVSLFYGAKADFTLAFPWRVMLGTAVTAAVALCFRTPANGATRKTP